MGGRREDLRKGEGVGLGGGRGEPTDRFLEMSRAIIGKKRTSGSKTSPFGSFFLVGVGDVGFTEGGSGRADARRDGAARRGAERGELKMLRLAGLNLG